MRLDRLDLTRYGRFTDRTLDFGTAVPGRPDLHIVFGPNEAGKSTLLNAWLDLLFGVPNVSPFNFLHDYKSMQIGATVSLAGGTHRLVRTKGQKGTLTEGGAPFAETTLTAAMGGLDRTACAEMFALDAETMEKGGESILSSKGNLGELLFSATAGLSELSRRLDHLREEGRKFWFKGARSGRLKELRADLAALDDEARALDVQAPEYARRRAALDTARTERDRLRAEETAARAARDRAQAMLDALPVLAEWRELQAQLAPLAPLPDAPADWADRVGELLRADIDLTATARAAAARIEQLQAALDGLTPDETALAQADAAGFDEELRAAYLAARRDLPKRREALAAVEARLAELAAATGGDPGDPPLDAATLDALDALATDHATHAERLRAAARESAQAAEALEAAGGAPDDTEAPDTTALRAALEPLRSADLAARLRTARAEADEAAARRDAALARLAPWQGDAAALRALDPPAPETLTRWRARLDAARSAHEIAARTASDRTAEAQRRAAERDGLVATLGEAAPETVAAARAERDAAWAEHRARLDAASADAFAAAMAAHDRALEAQLARTADVARLHAARHDAATAAQLADRAVEARALAEAALDRTRAEIGAALAFLPGRDPADPLAGLGDWLAVRRGALDLADAADTAARAAERARDHADHAAAALAAALGMQGDLPALAAEAQARLDRADADAARRAERRRLAAALARRRQDETAARRAVDDWTVALREALADTPLADDPPAPARLRALLPLLRARAATLREADDLRHRIATMQSDQHHFADAAARLARALDLPQDDPAATHAAAAARLDLARQTAARRRTVESDIAEARQTFQTQAEARARLDAEAAVITQRLDAADLTDAQRKLADIARRTQLRGNADRRAAQLRGMLGVASIDAAAAALDTTTEAELREALARTVSTREDAETRLDLARQALFAAEQALDAVPADERVARLGARRRTLLLAIEDEARAWLRQRAGVLATGHALDAYRATHRGAMMGRASDAFAAITGGAYAGLTAQPAEGTERLIALAADGGSKPPEALSKGTRFQLYLALRIAGFHEWTAAHGPVPVVADDIMETFDDERTRLALGALAEMSRTGQAIYLTHHRHVCDLARAACPEVRIIEL